MELNDRYIDLVIKDQNKMDILLRYLIFTFRTVNGVKNSAEEVMKHVYREESEVKKKVRFAKMDEEAQQRYWDKYSGTIYRKVFLKYQVMRFRSKVSFEALKKCMTIRELIVFAILKAYQTQQFQGDIQGTKKFTNEENKLFLEYIGNEINTLHN